MPLFPDPPHKHTGTQAQRVAGAGHGSSAEANGPACGGGESFALMVLGQSMTPEFNEGEIIIIEPEGLIKDGSYVLACVDGDWTFRRLVRAGTGWILQPLNPAFADVPLADLGSVHGVIIQKAVPGRRSATRHFI